MTVFTGMARAPGPSTMLALFLAFVALMGWMGWFLSGIPGLSRREPQGAMLPLMFWGVLLIFFSIIILAAMEHGRDWPRTYIGEGRYHVIAILPSIDECSLSLVLRLDDFEGKEGGLFWDCLYVFPKEAFEGDLKDPKGDCLTVLRAGGYKFLRLSSSDREAV